MNNAIMYDYVSYHDSESECVDKETTKDVSLDAKVRRLMEEKGICVEEVDDTNENKSGDGSEVDEVKNLPSALSNQ